MNTRRAISLLFGIFAAILVARFVMEARELQHLPWAAFMQAALAGCALSCINYFLRFLRWHGYLQRLGASVPWHMSLLCYVAGFAYTLVPGKVGELMRIRYYRRFGVDSDAISAAFVVERLLDVTAVALLVTIGAGSAMSASTAAWSLLGASAAATVAVVVIRRWALLRAVPFKHGDGFKSKAVAWVSAALMKCSLLLKPGPLVWGFVAGLVAWALEGVGFWLLVEAGGADAYTLLDAIAVYSFGLLMGAISFLPGGLGSAEATMLYALQRAGSAAGTALAITLLCRLTTLWLAVLLGAVAVGILRLVPVKADDAV